MSRRSEQKKILQELAGMLVAKLFAHMFKDGTNINDEAKGLEVQSFNSQWNNNYENDSNDDGFISLPLLYMDILNTKVFMG